MSRINVEPVDGDRDHDSNWESEDSGNNHRQDRENARRRTRLVFEMEMRDRDGRMHERQYEYDVGPGENDQEDSGDEGFRGFFSPINGEGFFRVFGPFSTFFEQLMNTTTQEAEETIRTRASRRAIDNLKYIALTEAKEKNCSICFEQYEVVEDEEDPPISVPEDEKLKDRSEKKRKDEKNHSPVVMPCGHEFGFSCLESWLLASNSCPVCRTKVESENEFQKQELESYGSSTRRDLESESSVEDDIDNANEERRNQMDDLLRSFITNPINHSVEAFERAIEGDRDGQTSTDPERITTNGVGLPEDFQSRLNALLRMGLPISRYYQSDGDDVDDEEDDIHESMDEVEEASDIDSDDQW